MSVEDKVIAMNVRRTIVRTTLDISELQIGCIRGVVEMTGRVKPPPNRAGEINVRKEFRTLCDSARSTRGVKEINFDRVQIMD